MAETVPNEATEKEIHALHMALEDGHMGAASRIINGIPGSEAAMYLESMPGEQRLQVWELIDEASQGEVLISLHDEVRNSLIENLNTEELVEATRDLDLDDMADIIVDLPEELSNQLMLSMDKTSRDMLHQVLSYPEDSAGGLMNPDVLRIRTDVSVDVVLRYLQFRDNIP